METKRENQVRIAYYDNIKLLMVVMMVIGHFVEFFTQKSNICQSIYLFIYAFHMPMLIFISGLFYTNKNNTKKAIYFICCGFALKFALSIVRLICGKDVNFFLLSDSGTPWFMFALAAYQFGGLFFHGINKRFLLCFFIILACFMGYDTSIQDYLYISRIVVFAPFFLLGTMLSSKKYVISKFNPRIMITPALCIMLLWFYCCFFKTDVFYIYRHLFTGRNPFSSTVVSYGPLARLLCYGITVATCSSLLVLVPRGRIPFFSLLGRRTLNIYFWHYIIFMLLDRFLNIRNIYQYGIAGNVIAGKITFILIGIILSIILSSFRIFDYPLNIIKRNCYRNIN